MPGPMAKHPSVRQRANKTSTHAVLKSVSYDAPPMPPGDWREEAVLWWNAIWRSPMRQEFAGDSDERVLVRMLRLEQAIWDAWDAGEARTAVALQGEMRQQEKRFGFTPDDRRRLQYQIEVGEAAEERTVQRRQSRAKKSGPKAVDPRELLA